MSDMAKTKPMRRKTTKREKKEWVAAYIFIAPLVIGIFVFYIYPFIQNFWFSFNDVNRFNISTFTGLENYKALIKDKELYRTLGNTIKYVIITVPVGICLSILIATLLNAKIRGTSIYRTIYFLPSVTMSVAIALVWKWMYNGEFGILNNILGAWNRGPELAL